MCVYGFFPLQGLPPLGMNLQMLRLDMEWTSEDSDSNSALRVCGGSDGWTTEALGLSLTP